MRTATKAADQESAVGFLKHLRPRGPWTLAAVIPDGRIQVVSFGGAEGKAMRDWIEARNGCENLYFIPNPTKRRMNRKPRETDIARVDFLHSEIDPLADESPEACLKRGRAALKQFDPLPSVIWDSGNGVQALWRLLMPVKLDGLDAIRECKSANIGIAQALGGKAGAGADSVQSLEHLLRLPGTVNLPDKRKRAKGRVETRAGNVEYFPDRAYCLFEFPIPDTIPGIGSDEEIEVGTPESIESLSELMVSDRIRQIIEHGRVEGETKQRDDSRSAWECEAICAMIGAGTPNETILGVLLDDRFAVGERVREKPNPEDYGRKEIVRLHKQAPQSAPDDFDGVDWDGKIEADPQKTKPDLRMPMRNARLFREGRRPTLMHYNGDWLAYENPCYWEIEDATIKSELYRFAAEHGLHPDKKNVAFMDDALRGLAHVPLGKFTPPCWLGGDGPFPANEILACTNGLLHLPSGKILEPTNRFFTRNGLTYSFDPKADRPQRWLTFLKQVWPESPESIAALQEIMGYLLLPDISQQKIFLWDSPTRGGKGTMARVLTKLIGQHNVASPSLNGVSKDAILASLIAKQVAFVSDMRLGKNSNLGDIAENLLRISGNDMLTFDRKYKSAWTGYLTVRFFILTNLPPAIPDVSGALINRMVPLKSYESFLGREDPDLDSKLAPELPGILNWTIEGWKRLKARGRFELTRDGEALLRQMMDLASPLPAFLRERCILDPLASVPKDELYLGWSVWEGERDGVPHRNEVHFARDLLAACRGKIQEARLGPRGERVQSWQGIRLRDPFDD